MEPIKFLQYFFVFNIPDINWEYLLQGIQQILLSHLACSHDLSSSVDCKANDIFLML